MGWGSRRWVTMNRWSKVSIPLGSSVDSDSTPLRELSWAWGRGLQPNCPDSLYLCLAEVYQFLSFWDTHTYLDSGS